MSDPIEEARAKIHELPASRGADNGGAARGAPSTTSDATRMIRELLSLEDRGAAEYFCDDASVPHALINLGDGSGVERWEMLPVGSEAFRIFLRQRCYRETSKALPRKASEEVADTIAAHAESSGDHRTVFVRLGHADGAIYLDLCDNARTIVEITASGRHLLRGTKPPVMFLRPRASIALPEPTKGGSLADLEQLIHLSGDNLAKLQAWLIGAMRPQPPYPVLELTGEQGSGKSTIARFLCELLDPGKAGIRALPQTERDLAVAGNNRRVLAFDNLRGLAPLMSDALCRFADGTGFATRKHYSNDEESIFEGGAPIILTGINRPASSPDLIDRLVSVEVAALNDNDRKDSEALARRFDEALPRLLGALCSAASAALAARAEPGYRAPAGLGRDPAWVAFVLAGAKGAGLDRDILVQALASSRREGAESALERSPLAGAVRELYEETGPKAWRSGDLHAELTRRAQGDSPAPPREWPANPVWMSRQLTTLAQSLRRVGVPIAFEHSRRDRLVILGELPESDH